MAGDVFFIFLKCHARHLFARRPLCLCRDVVDAGPLTKECFVALQKSNNNGPTSFLHAVLYDQDVFHTMNAIHRMESSIAGRRGSAVVQSVSEQFALFFTQVRTSRRASQTRFGSRTKGKSHLRFWSRFENKRVDIWSEKGVNRNMICNDGQGP